MKGLLSFCDILGYQSFLKNNSATEPALKVLEIIATAPAQTKDFFEKKWQTVVSPESVEVSAALKHLVFSDTIVLMMPFPEGADDKWIHAAIAYLTFFTGHLKCKMFLEGLPLRCVIHEGEFIAKESCLAGNAVVDSYGLAEKLDLSALVFSPSLSSKISEFQKSNPIFASDRYDEYFVEYFTPIKDNSEQSLLHFNWIAFMDKMVRNKCISDVDKFVLKAFWSHRKDCPMSVDRKVHATSKLIRRLLIAINE